MSRVALGPLCSLSLDAEQPARLQSGSARDAPRSSAAQPTATRKASRSAASAAFSHTTYESYEWLLPRSTQSVRVGDQSVVTELRARKTGLLQLPLLRCPMPAAAYFF